MNKICLNCRKTCDRLRKDFCNYCYNKNRLFGDPNYVKIRSTIEFTEKQINLIHGSMLGDGHLKKRKIEHNASLSIRRAQKDINYLEWEAKILNNILTDSNIVKQFYYDKRTNKKYYFCGFETKCLIELNEFHSMWYENKIKIVPNNLKLNSEIIAIWFCDDGSITTSSSDNRFRISFATNSFSKNEVYFLRDLLNDRYNENFTVSCRHDTEKEQYVLHGSDAATRTLIFDIDPVFPKGMERKRLWEDPKTCFYENIPIRRESHQLSSEDKKSKILEFFKINDEFYLIDLAIFSGFSFNRKKYERCKEKEAATSNIRKCYLNDFIKDGLIVQIGRDKGPDYCKGIKMKLTDSGKKYFQTESISNL